jgi:hypothetical protein
MDTIYPYNCPTCQKKYKRHFYFSRHKLVCHPSSLTEECSLVNSPLTQDMLAKPSQVMQVLEHLLASNNSLKQEINELKQQGRIQKQSIDILSWLNKTFKSSLDFKIYSDQIKIVRKDLENVFTDNLMECLKKIFIKHFEQNECPYKAFDQKEKTIYVFTRQSDWKILTMTDFAQFINIISQGLIAEFNVWQDENYHRIFADSFSEIYLRNTKKINSINLNTSRSLNMLYKILYNHLKVPLNVIEYEIT